MFNVQANGYGYFKARAKGEGGGGERERDRERERERERERGGGEKGRGGRALIIRLSRFIHTNRQQKQSQFCTRLSPGDLNIGTLVANQPGA